MKKILYILAFAISAVAFADPPVPYDEPSNKTQLKPTEEQSVTPRADDVDMKTKVSKPEATTAGTLSSKDIETLQTLHKANVMETEMGKIAKKNGGSQQVKSYGDRLIKDHQLADKQIVAFAKKYNVDLKAPEPADEAAKADAQAEADHMKRLETMKGEEFDRDFAQMMVDGHTKAVSLVEATLTTTQDAKLHSLLNKLLPVLKEHLKLAEKLQASNKAA